MKTLKKAKIERVGHRDNYVKWMIQIKNLKYK